MARIPNILGSHLGHPISLCLHVANMFALGHCITSYGFTHSTPMGPSMLPTHSVIGEGLIISKYYRYGRGVRVGDEVAFRSPINPESEAIKRVIGMPGDYVLVNAPRLDGHPEQEATMMQVPQGHCWLVGDNLPVSRDSRTYGPVPLGLIRGKIIAQLTPWSERRWITNPLATDQDRSRQREVEQDTD